MSYEWRDSNIIMRLEMQNQNNTIETLHNGLFYNSKTVEFSGFAIGIHFYYNTRLNMQGEEKF